MKNNYIIVYICILILHSLSTGEITNNNTSARSFNPVNIELQPILDYTLNKYTRIVFVNVTGNLRTLCLVDYSKPGPAVNEFKDIKDVYHPVISPDGKYVAFSNTDGKGSVTTSRIFMRYLDSLNSPVIPLPQRNAFAPQWWTNPGTHEIFITYSNSCLESDSPAWKSSRIYMLKFLDGKFSGPTQLLSENGSFTGGMSPDRQFIVTGSGALKMKQLHTGTVKNLFQSPYNGKTTDGSTHVCDVSICPDSAFSGFCMFLDSGYNSKSTLTKCSYNPHEYMFISNFKGETVRWVKKPPSEKAWKNPQWSNQLNYAVSGTEGYNENKNTIYLIKFLKDREEIHKLISGVSLAEPALWLSKNFSDTFDSSGRYDLPPVYWNNELIALKMAGFWKCHDSIDILFAGSSHTYNSIYPEVFTRKVYNLGISGLKIPDILAIVNDYALNHCKNLKLAGIDLIIGGLFLSDGDSKNSSFRYSTGYVFDKNHDFWKNSIPDQFLKAILKLPLPENYQTYLTKGAQSPCKGWGQLNQYYQNAKRSDLQSPEFLSNFNLLKVTIDSFKNRKIHLLVMIVPVSPHYSNTPGYGLYGPEKEIARTVISKILELKKDNPYLHLYDAYQEGKNDYIDSDASDRDHLCTNGAIKFSKRVDSLVTVILKK